MIHGILIKDGTIQETDLEDKLETYYEALSCELIEIVVRRIGGKEFDIVCDEEGLYHDGYISMMNEVTHAPMLVGSLFICNNNGKGKLTSLTTEECEHIKQNWKFHVLWGNY